MSTFRLKSKLYARRRDDEFEGEERPRGILGTGITLGGLAKTAALAGTAYAGYKALGRRGTLGEGIQKKVLTQDYVKGGKNANSAYAKLSGLGARQQRLNNLELTNTLDNIRSQQDLIANSGIYGAKGTAQKFAQNTLGTTFGLN